MLVEQRKQPLISGRPFPKLTPDTVNIWLECLDGFLLEHGLEAALQVFGTRQIAVLVVEA